MSYEYMTGMGATASGATAGARTGTGTRTGTQTGAQAGATTGTRTGTQQATTAGTRTGTRTQTRARMGQTQIPSGMVPLSSNYRSWFIQWLRTVDSKAYQRQQQKDSRWTYTSPGLLARFMNAKRQFDKNFRGAVDYAVTSSGQRKSQENLATVQQYVNAMMIVWNKCDPDGAAAWKSSPQNRGALRLPRNYDRAVAWNRIVRLGKDQYIPFFRDPTGKTRAWDGDARYVDSIKRLTCPDEDMQALIWNRPKANQRIKGSTILANYVRAKSRRMAQAATSSRQRIATQQRELRASQQEARAAAAEAQAQRQAVTALQNELAQLKAAFDQARARAAQGMPVSNEALASMQSDVTDLTLELAEANEDFSELQYEADLAEDLFNTEYEVYSETDPTLPSEVPDFNEELPPLDPTIAGTPPLDPMTFEPMPEDVMPDALTAPAEAAVEPSFLDQYKWHLLIGGGIAAAGAWYYFAKHKLAKEAVTLTTNFNNGRSSLYVLADSYDEEL